MHDQSLVINLSGQTPIAQGGERAVYADPSDPSRLIKVLLSAEHQKPGGPARRFFYRYYKGKRRFLIEEEFREVLRTFFGASDLTRLPIAQVLGVVPTDLGIGMITQRIEGADGRLAPTWHTVATSGRVRTRDIDALTQFARRVLESGLRCSDMTPHNVVLGHRRMADRKGPLEAVLVDGLGDTHVIPVRTWSKWANRRAVHKRLEQLARAASLIWDDEEQEFKRQSGEATAEAGASGTQPQTDREQARRV